MTCSVQEIPKPNYPLRRHEVFSTLSFLRGEIYKTFALLVICSARFPHRCAHWCRTVVWLLTAGSQHHPPHHLCFAPTHIVCSWACFLWTASGVALGLRHRSSSLRASKMLNKTWTVIPELFCKRKFGNWCLSWFLLWQGWEAGAGGLFFFF